MQFENQGERRCICLCNIVRSTVSRKEKNLDFRCLESKCPEMVVREGTGAARTLVDIKVATRAITLHSGAPVWIHTGDSVPTMIGVRARVVNNRLNAVSCAVPR